MGKEEKKSNNFIESVKLGFKELFNSKWKAIFLIIYSILVVYLIKKYIIYDHTFLKDFPSMIYPIVRAIINIFNEDSTFSLESLYLIMQNIFYGFVWLIAFLGLLQVIIFIGMIHSEGTIQDRISNVSFPDGLIPKHTGKKKDKNKKHGLILSFECEGLIKKDYIDKFERIESALRKYKVYKIREDDLDNAKMYIYCIPNKYAKPMLISKDTFFLDFFQINMLLTRSHRNREVHGNSYFNENICKFFQRRKNYAYLL